MRLLPIVVSLLLAACTAPNTQEDAGRQRAGVAQQRPVAAETPQSGRRVKMPPLGGPLPPERVQGYCETDTDCSVRADRHGCGVCASRGDATDASPSNAATCGMQETEGCRCVDHRCAAKPRLIDSPVEQAATTDDTP